MPLAFVNRCSKASTGLPGGVYRVSYTGDRGIGRDTRGTLRSFRCFGRVDSAGTGGFGCDTQATEEGEIT